MMIVVQDGTIQIERLALGPFGTNAYIITCPKTQASLLIDAPAEAAAIAERLMGTTPQYILMTHSHMDHTGALLELKSNLQVPLAAHTLDARNLPLPPDILLPDGEIISLGNLTLEVRHTPGHTPGSLCFRAGNYLISGDTIFPGGPGKTQSPADFRQIVKSITEKIFVLPDDTQIYPGHGEATLLKREKDQFTAFSRRPSKPNLYGDVLWLSA